jgi:hypothetical protein
MSEPEMVECPECGGQGWISGTGSEHAPGCDGECRDCPVPVEIQIGCEFCDSAGVCAPPAVTGDVCAEQE